MHRSCLLVGHLLSSGAVQGSGEPGVNLQGRVELWAQKTSQGEDLPQTRCLSPCSTYLPGVEATPQGGVSQLRDLQPQAKEG